MAKRGRKPDPSAITRRNEMRALYRGGMTLKDIGRRYGVSRERARQIIALGINARLKKPLPPTVVPRDATKHHERMIEMHSQGSLIRVIAKKLGLSSLTVQRHLTALGYGVGKGRR